MAGAGAGYSGGGGDGGGDAELASLREELTEFGLDEENLSKEEMCDLLKALRSSKTSATEEQHTRSVTAEKCSEPAKTNVKLVRRPAAVVDRRLPWCLLPPNLTPGQKVKCLAAYIKLLSINQYMKARNSLNFEPWGPAIQITSDSGTRSQSTRATRSGRTAPSYTNIDDDFADIGDFTVKRKKRKVSNSENTSNSEIGIYSNKTFSLKRKQKTECSKHEKEIKMDEISEYSICDVEIKDDIVDDGELSHCNTIALCNSSSDSGTKESSKVRECLKTKQRKVTNT